MRCIFAPCFPETRLGVALFLYREVYVHIDEHGEHQERDKRWPLQQEAEHDDRESDVLWVAHFGVRTCGRKFAVSLGLIQDMPGFRQQIEAAEHENDAEDVRQSKMWVAVATGHHPPDVT